jgi:hypothetical protein
MKRFDFVHCLVLAAIVSWPATAAELYVSPNGNNTTGTSWATAVHTLDAAVALVDVTHNDIWVAAGTYLMTAPVSIPSNVSVYGGFPAVGNPTMDARDPSTNTTTLNGQNTAESLIHCEAVSNVLIDGFAMTGSIGGGSSFSKGGAVRCFDSSADITIRDCVFHDNNISGYGGGANIYRSSARIERCTFRDNSSSEGGAVKLHQATLVMRDCVFDTNTSNNLGGGFGSYDSTVDVERCVFLDNMSGTGGAFECHEGDEATLRNCVFAGNGATNLGGAVNFSDEADVLAANNTFYNNMADNGGGSINWHDSAGAIANSIFSMSNEAIREGDNGDSPSVLNNLFYANTNGIYSDDVQGVLSTVGGGAGLNSLVAEAADNIEGDPVFEKAAVDDFRLRLISPAIDAGTDVGAPSDDLLGATRPYDEPNATPNGTGTEFDIGAYEFSFSRRDVNHNGSVNIIDLQEIVNVILGNDVVEGTFPDVTGDGNVNIIDLQEVVEMILGLF